MQGLVSSTLTTGDFSLEVVEGPHEGLTLYIEKDIIRIGREDWCDLVLPDDPWVSVVHCECFFDEKGLRVRDLKSRNGIKLNDAPVLDAYLVPGSKLQVGLSVLKLRSHQKTQERSISFYDNTQSLLGKSMAMRKIFTILPRLAQRNITTLLSGETGTGKTSIAKAIHLEGHPDDAPFVVVNCGALPPSLIESALFGHEKGAFTGANQRKEGFFEQAHGGTLFLDEIAELPLDLQPKLLDVLERRKVRRLGGAQEIDVDFHLLTATHKTLADECKAGRFREDLFFRLSVMELVVPPLRERVEDIPLLVEAFLKELNPEQAVYLTGDALDKLQRYLWPGNIRELKNVLERVLVFLEGDSIGADALELERRSGKGPSSSFWDDKRKWVEEAFPSLPLGEHDPPLSLKDILKHAERFYITQALDETNFNAPEAAQLLSLSESWLYSRVRLYGLNTKKRSRRD